MNQVVTGRCYCGTTTRQSTESPQAVAYCHCDDCRRVTGAPVAAFVAFKDAAVSLKPNEGKSISVNSGVTRTFCESCGTPLTGRYDYLPNVVYIPLGILDQANEFPPELHAHESNCYDWLSISDQCKRFPASARVELNKKT